MLLWAFSTALLLVQTQPQICIFMTLHNFFLVNSLCRTFQFGSEGMEECLLQHGGRDLQNDLRDDTHRAWTDQEVQIVSGQFLSLTDM